MLVALDIGHGCKDPGAVAKDGTKETDLAETLVRGVADLLRRITSLFNLDDEYMITGGTNCQTLNQRVNAINKAGADLALSFHFNSASNPTAQGYETLSYYVDELRNKIHNEIYTAVNKSLATPDRGLKQRQDLAILRDTNPLALLFEIEFISNTEQLDKIQTQMQNLTLDLAFAVMDTLITVKEF